MLPDPRIPTREAAVCSPDSDPSERVTRPADFAVVLRYPKYGDDRSTLLALLLLGLLLLPVSLAAGNGAADLSPRILSIVMCVMSIFMFVTSIGCLFVVGRWFVRLLHSQGYLSDLRLRFDKTRAPDGSPSVPASDLAPALEAIFNLRLARRRIPWSEVFKYRRRTELSRDELDSQLRAIGLRPPSLIIDQKYAQAVQAIQCVPELLEPEFVASRGDRRSVIRTILARSAWALVVIPWLWYRLVPAFADPVWLLFCFVCFAVVAAWLSIARYRGTLVQTSDLVAGLGVVAADSGWRARAADSVTLLRPVEGEMKVTIMAPSGTISLPFASPRDEGFIIFWQRWNHPHPRPELLGEQAAT